jgi:hypothetical protein
VLTRHRSFKFVAQVGLRESSRASFLASLGMLKSRYRKAPWGGPIWPAGIVGSLAHDARVAVAAVAKTDHVAALGIDVEPAQVLPPELVELVATPQEQQRITDDPFHGRLFFVAKEAVYKAVYPIERTFLDYHDIEIDLAKRRAKVRDGGVVDIRFCISAHICQRRSKSRPMSRRKTRPVPPSLVVADAFAGELTRGSFKTISATEETTNTQRFEADSLAVGAGFEPAIRFPAYTLSRRAPSTTRPPLHGPHVDVTPAEPSGVPIVFTAQARR